MLPEVKEVNVNIFAPTKPHEKQQEVLDALDSGTRWVILRCGRKWRKTSLIVSWLFENAMDKPLVFPYIAPSRKQAKDIVWGDHIARILNEFKKKGVPYKENSTELSVQIEGAGKIQLFGVENKEGLRGISNWGGVGMDEYDDWQEDIWPLIIRPNLMVHKAPAIISGTPKGFRNLYHLSKAGRFKEFHFTSYDNPELDREELDEMVEEYKEMGEDYFRQEIMAEYVKPVGVVYEEWDFDKQYIPFKYDKNLPLHLTWDFGVNDPTAVLFIQPAKDEIRIVDYIELSDSNLSAIVATIKDKGYKKPELETGDIAGRARSLVNGRSPIAELAQMDHIITSNVIPNIPTQIRHTHKFMRKVYVNSDMCSRVRDCFLNYRYPIKNETARDQSNEIPIHDEFSHIMRALEYYFWNRYDPSLFKTTKKAPVGTFQRIMEQKEYEAKLESMLAY